MNIPVLSLLGFTLWTIVLLLATVGVYRWRRILARRVAISSFIAGDDHGDEWYGRAMRAHANCLENLPIFAVLVFAAAALGVEGRWLDGLAILVLGARIVHSLIHLCFVQTDRVVLVRFLFFVMQLISFLVMAIVLIRHALAVG
jgi:uncharacterized MAPEG superfamily protein